MTDKHDFKVALDLFPEPLSAGFYDDGDLYCYFNEGNIAETIRTALQNASEPEKRAVDLEGFNAEIVKRALTIHHTIDSALVVSIAESVLYHLQSMGAVQEKPTDLEFRGACGKCGNPIHIVNCFTPVQESKDE